jgi:hypothetical protein
MRHRPSSRLAWRAAGLAALGTIVAARASKRRGAPLAAPAAPVPATLAPVVREPAGTAQIHAARLPEPEPGLVRDVAPGARRAAEDTAIGEAIARGIRDVAAIAAHVVAVTDRQRSSPALRRRIEQTLGAGAPVVQV